MNDVEMIKIGDLFTLEKGSLQSTKCTAGEYTFITASSDWKTHNQYSYDCEALIYAVAASGSLGRCHHFHGKFILSDLCFVLQAKNEKQYPVNYRFYQNIFNFLRKDIVSQTKAGTSKESISYKRLSNYRLPYFDIRHQSIWEHKLNNLNSQAKSLNNESAKQSAILAKLRQAILQEAIEGKLTDDWRKANPVRNGDTDYDAAALLAKIKAEKQKLIAEKKIKKEKPLSPIKAEDVPLAAPDGWVWTRLGEITEKLSTGPFGSMLHKSDYVSDGIPLVNPINMIRQGIQPNQKMIVSDETAKRLSHYILKENDIVIARRGNLSKCAIITKEQESWLCGTGSFFMHLLYVNINFFILFYRSKYFQDYLLHDSIGQTMNNLNQKLLTKATIPLPPLDEQRVIVERVEKMLAMVDELEAQVKERQGQTAALLQAVLREAFEGDTLSANVSVANVVPFPVAIPNISTTDLHVGILAVAYDLHEKNQKQSFFGHVKAEKIAHMIESFVGIDLGRNPIKDAAGPSDFLHLINKVESRAIKAGYFKFERTNSGRYIFKKLSQLDKLLDTTQNVLGEKFKDVHKLLQLMLPLDTQESEVVATIYAAWNNLLLLKQSITDEAIIYEARENWHPEKLKIPHKNFFNALTWIRENNIIPQGRGKLVKDKVTNKTRTITT
jgi:type I restriction enzyme S subunit